MKDLHTLVLKKNRLIAGYLVPSQVNLGINFKSNPVKALSPFVLAFVACVRKRRGIGDAMADLEGGGPPPPLFLDQNEARRAENLKAGIPLTDIHTYIHVIYLRVGIRH